MMEIVTLSEQALDSGVLHGYIYTLHVPPGLSAAEWECPACAGTDCGHREKRTI